MLKSLQLFYETNKLHEVIKIYNEPCIIIIYILWGWKIRLLSFIHLQWILEIKYKKRQINWVAFFEKPEDM